MLTEEQQKDLNFLKAQKGVIIPPRFTFWIHHTSYNEPKYFTTKYDRSWTEIPTNDFVVKSQMSFVRAYDWIKDMVKYGQTEPSYKYACPKGAMPFRIIVIQPRHNTLEEMYDGDEYKKRVFEENGLGDGRHQKIAGNTHLYIFACKTKGKKASEIDTIYAVREQDLAEYVNDIKRVYEDCTEFNFKEERLGINIIDRERKIVEEDNSIKILLKDSSFLRFKDRLIGSKENGLTMLAPYKQDLIKMHEADESSAEKESTLGAQ